MLFRSFMNHDLAAKQFVNAWLIPLAVAAVGIGFALRSLNKRLAAT